MPSTRRRRHLGLAGFVAFVCVAALVLTLPVHGPLRGLSFGLGYASLALLLLTLAIGPWTVIRGRQMPVSTMFRRDVGIWAGLTGCLHVGFGLQSHFGGRIVRYFFLDGSGWVPDLSPFGLANWVGAGATLILVGLLLLSNTLSLRVLGAGRWKSWQ
nr:hypothetical protein [Chloroflexota bacterium]